MAIVALAIVLGLMPLAALFVIVLAMVSMSKENIKMRRTLPLLILALFGLCSAVSHAQTTYTIDPGPVYWLENALSPDITYNNHTLAGYLYLEPWYNPISTRAIYGIPELLARNAFGSINLNSTYQIAYATAHFTTSDGVVHTGIVPSMIMFTWVEADVNGSNITTPANPLTGSGTIMLGNYVFEEHVNRCGACDGWHFGITSGIVTVNAPGINSSASKARPLSNSAPYPNNPDPDCQWGQLVTGAYPAFGWRALVSTWWYGAGCWEEDKVIWVEWDFPILN